MPKNGGEWDDLRKTLQDFTSKENWDKFFTIRGNNESFEWYAEWTQLEGPLLSHLTCFNSSIASTDLDEATDPVQTSAPVQILIPACGNSRLSEHIYDAGYRGITNIDFSKVVISDMLSRNVRLRPEMRWRVMDMTAMQFPRESFNAVVDKGGLDALMEPEAGSKLGSQYLSEVKRVLRPGGRFICLTLGESHVLGLLFSKFRFGWRMSLHAIPHESSKNCKFQTFMAVVDKDVSIVSHQIIASLAQTSVHFNGNKAHGFYEVLKNENSIRKGFACCSLEDLQLDADGELRELRHGRRIQLTIDEGGGPCPKFRTIIFDAREQSGSFTYHCGVFLVPKCRAHEWLFSSEEGQWTVVESSKAARLIMVFLENNHTDLRMDDIQKDLSPLIKQLALGNNDNDAQIPFMIASDGFKHRTTVHQVTSSLTGSMIVEDVIYEKLDGDLSRLLPSEDLVFRRLTFQRSQGLVQSEALLIKKGSSQKFIDETERKKSTSSSKSRKRVNLRGRSGSSKIKEFSEDMVVDHNFLASSYHTGIISGLMLISSHLDSMASTGKYVKTVVIGLGAGVFPMFLHRCMPFVDIEVVELDAAVLEVAREWFSFSEDERLKVHIGDGVGFVKDGSKLKNVDVLVIDVDSVDLSSGMTCPGADFVELPFLLAVKEGLGPGGLFVVNLVSRSAAITSRVVSRMKSVFTHLFWLEVEEDVNVVVFALDADPCLKETEFEEAVNVVTRLVRFNEAGIVSAAMKIRCLQ